MLYTIERTAAYLSHLPILSAAMSMTTGPVLELGAGLGSTYLLHGLCGSAKRQLTTIESDEAWLRRFSKYGRPWHIFRKVEDYLDLPEYGQEWGLAFVDHGLYRQRGLSVRRLAHVPVVVVHDTCFPWLYDYTGPIEEYRYRWDYRVDGPQTTVLSNTRDIRQELGGMAL